MYRRAACSTSLPNKCMASECVLSFYPSVISSNQLLCTLTASEWDSVQSFYPAMCYHLKSVWPVSVCSLSIAMHCAQCVQCGAEVVIFGDGQFFSFPPLPSTAQPPLEMTKRRKMKLVLNNDNLIISSDRSSLRYITTPVMVQQTANS